ncbi:MAG: hypothetical protein IJH34_15960 [Romboutsia sp.]|nr:hypothetical protein [Romboutsia sp.]
MNSLFRASLLATKKLDLALDHNQLDEFLCGYPVYQMDEVDEKGNEIPNSKLIMEAIYRIHNSRPEIELDKMTFDTIKELLKTDKSSEDILNILDNIEYQIEAEKSGTATFKMNCEELLKALKENLIENKELYESGSYKDMEFIRMLNEKQEKIKESMNGKSI